MAKKYRISLEMQFTPFCLTRHSNRFTKTSLLFGLLVFGLLHIPPVWAGPQQPGTPQNFTVPATSSNGSYAITWSASIYADYYELNENYNNNGWGKSNATACSDTSCSFSGKIAGTYQYRLRACSYTLSISCSSYTTIRSIQVTNPLPAPGAPSSLTHLTSILESKKGSFTLQWGHASGQVGAYVLEESFKPFGGGYGSYVIQYRGTHKSLTLNEKNNGYWTYKVKACNTNNGNEQCSSSLFLGQEILVFKAPPKPAITLDPGTPGKFTVSWESVTGASQYLYSLNSVVQVPLLTSTRLTQSNKPSGTYTYAVQAIGSYGLANWSDSSSITLSYAPITVAPSMTSALNQTASLATGSILLSWNPVSGASRYKLTYGSTILSNDSSTSFRYDNQNYGNYTFQLQACNPNPGAAGCGPVSNQTISLQFAPAKNLSGPVNSRNTFILKWNGATHAMLEENGALDSKIYNAVSSYQITLTRNIGTYRFRLKSCFLGDTADPSQCTTPFGEAITVNVMGAPSAPPILQLPKYINGDTVTATWQPGSGIIDTYQLDYQHNNGATINAYNGSNLSATLSNLSEGGYSFKIRACNTLDNITLCSPDRLANPLYLTGLPKPMGTPELPPQSNNDVGALAGKGDVSGGAATYNIPIQVVPGRNGMQANVSLNYTSRGSNDVVGAGWSLNASNSIQRCAATFAQDGFSAAAQYHLTRDRLCLDGQRLMATQGIYGASNTVYRTELDAFIRVTQYGSLNAITSYFIAEYQNGNKLFFGNTADSRHIAEGRTETLTWALSRTEDPAGNSIHYYYTHWGAGEYTLSSIKYTGTRDTPGDRAVEFEYTNRIDPNGATDYSSSYLAGGLTRQTQRLRTIRTQYQNTTVHEYALYYGSMSLSSGRTLLRQVQKCAYKNQQPACLPATRFDWQEAEPQYLMQPIEFNDIHNLVGGGTIPANNHRYISNVIPRGDINGDGIRDWPGKDTNSDGEIDQPGYHVNAEGEISGIHHERLGGCYQTLGMLKPICPDADFNQDGKTDSFKILYSFVGPSSILIKYAGSSPWIDTRLNLPDHRDELLSFDDMNGDGWPDITISESETPNQSIPSYYLNIYVYLHSKNPNQPYTPENRIFIYKIDSYTVSNGNGIGALVQQSYAQNVELPGDMDGNGTPDYLISRNHSPYETSTPPGLPVPQKILFTHSQTDGKFTLSEFQFTTADYLPINHISLADANFFQDINGDDLPDWLSIDNDYFLEAKLNQGGRFQSSWQNLGVSVPMRRYEYAHTNGEPESYSIPILSKTLIMDYNGDNKPELLTAGAIQASACSQVMHFVHGTSVMQWFCDEGIWNALLNFTSTSSLRSPISDPERKDISARHYNAIYFTESLSGMTTAQKKPTAIIAAVGEHAVLDANGDGLADVITTYQCKIENCRWNTDTTSFSNTQQDSRLKPTAYIIRNRGAADSNSPSEAIDLIKKITDGLNEQHLWTYRALNSNEYNTPQAAYYSPDHDYLGGGIAAQDEDYYHFGSSMNVVAEYQTSNGIGGLNSTRYRYSGATYHNQGRGFMGFRSITAENITQGTKTKNLFHQKWPLASQVQYTCTWPNNAAETLNPQQIEVCPDALTEEQFTYAEKSPTFATRWVGVQDHITIHRDPDTHVNLSQATDRFTYDLYSNILTHTAIHEDAFGRVTHETTHLYENDESIWWINKPSKTLHTQKTIERNTQALAPLAGTDDTKTLTTLYRWNPQYRMPSRVTEIGGDTTDTQYNNQGSPILITRGGDLLTPRTVQNGYTADGYFISLTTNALNHPVRYTTDPAHGKIIQTIDPNNLITDTRYDAFGRIETTQMPGQPPIYTRYRHCDSRCKSLQIDEAIDPVEYLTVTAQAGRPETIEYHDTLGRVILTQQTAFDGDQRLQATRYNAKGEKIYESVPYLYGQPLNRGTHYSQYDILGRLTEKTIDQTENQRLTTRYTYNNYTTSLTAANLSLSRTYNGLNQLIQTIDAHGSQTHYAYDSAGNPIALQDPDGYTLYNRYDAFGHKLWVNDPDQGITQFTYNAYDELIHSIDANHNTFTHTYDALGRRIETQLNGNPDSRWQYDTRSKGQLSQQQRENASKDYYYDEYARPSRITHTLDGATYSFNKGYDPLGRLQHTHYPDGPTLRYDYNNSGYLYKESNAATGETYTEITRQDARHNPTQILLADSMRTQATYDPNTGQMQTIQSLRNSDQSLLHNITYTHYDNFGNLRQSTQTHQNGQQTTETYTYDKLQRLTQSERSGTVTANPSITYAYNASGNLRQKSDYATSYTYGDAARSQNNAGPHAVRQIQKPNGQSIDFTYDANGNLLTGDHKTLTYTAHNQPHSLQQNGTTLTFHYSADQARYKQRKQTGSHTETLYYLDDQLEISQTDEQTTRRYYLNDYVLLEKIQTSTTTTENLRYLHKDRLNSIASLTDAAGNLLETRSYDPFGKPRTDLGQDKTPPRLASPHTPRGFTRHEHLDEVELIHMNGRIYDYNLARFYTVDPYIQSPDNRQSINPYSYIMNNPLAGTDPSGYIAFVAIPALIDLSAKAFALYGAFESGRTLGKTAHELARGEQQASAVLKDAATSLAVNTAVTVTGLGALRLANKVTPDSVKKNMTDPIKQALKDKHDSRRIATHNGETASQGPETKGTKPDIDDAKRIQTTANSEVEVAKGGDNFVDGYRAVSKAEADDIAKHGFRPDPSGRSMQDKWFSETREGAEKFRKNYSDLDDVVKAKVPKDVYDRSYKHPNIDNTGPGFCVACDDLSRLKAGQ